MSAPRVVWQGSLPNRANEYRVVAWTRLDKETGEEITVTRTEIQDQTDAMGGEVWNPIDTKVAFEIITALVDSEMLAHTTELHASRDMETAGPEWP